MSNDTPENAKSPQEILVGFPHLERLIEEENFDDLNKAFLETYEKLEKMAAGKADASVKKSARKGMRALEITMNILRDFMHVKEDLIRRGMQSDPKEGS